MVPVMYFTYLFHESYYNPEEVLSYFSSDITLLREIFFFTVENNGFADCQNVFLISFLSIDDLWVTAYAKMVYNLIRDGRNLDIKQYKALWMSEDYMRYFDRIFDTISDDLDDISEWRLSNAFKTILYHEKNDRVMYEQQKKWILHIIEQHATDDKVICLFSAISETEPELRKRAFQEVLVLNDNYEMFKNLQLDPNHWEGEVGGIIYDLKCRIGFLESLLPYVKGVKYLKHAKRIRNRIDFWKAQMEEEEMEIICRRLYR